MGIPLVERFENVLGKGDNAIVLRTYPVIPSFVHVCIYFEWFPLWLFLELDSL